MENTQLAKREKEPLVSWIEESMAEISLALPSFITPERFCRIAVTTIQSDEKLRKCSKESFVAALMTAAQLGLEPNTPLGEAYLIARYSKKNKCYECQFQMGYRGMINLARKAENFENIYAQVVYENDVFEYEFGLNPGLKHVPARKNKGAITDFYAVYKVKNGEFGFTIMSADEIDDHAKQWSQNIESDSSPWITAWIEMGKKTVLKRMLKTAPVSIEFQRQAAKDEGVETFNPEESQRKRMWVLLREAGYDEKNREGRLKIISQILKRKVDSSKSMTYADYLNVNAALEGGFTVVDIIDAPFTATDVTDTPPEKPKKLTEEQLNQINNLYIEAKWDSEKQEKYFSYMKEKNPGNFTANSAADFTPEEAEKFITFLKKKVIEADKKAMEIPPADLPEAPIIPPQERVAHVPASPSQIVEADELFQKLEYDWQKKLKFWEDYRYRTGETYVKSVKNMDFIKAGLLIEYLKKELAEKEKMENGQFPGGVTEEENQQEKQEIAENTIPTTEKIQDMFEGDVPF